MNFLATSALVVTAGLTAGCSDAPQIWFDRTAGTAAATRLWSGVASDATGAHLVAVNGPSAFRGDKDGGIWTSTDSGVNWTNRTTGTPASGQAWVTVASDHTGTHLVAATLVSGTSTTGDVWTSANAGATWVKRTTVTSTAGFLLAPTVMSDSTGTHLVLAAGDVWTSDNEGATWTDRTAGTAIAAQDWVHMASDATATHLVAITSYSDIWTSSDAGANWTNRTTGTAASGLDWQSVASDATGTHLVAVCELSITQGGVVYAGDIWTSSDAGVTWSNQTTGTPASGQMWAAVASDASGAHLVAASAHGRGNDIWMSSDSGATWSNQTTGTPASDQQWVALASNANGTHFVAVSDNPGGLSPLVGGDIWTH